MAARFTRIALCFALAAMLYGGSATAGQGSRIKSFRHLTTLNVEGPAEIIQATPDGMMLVYTDSKNGFVGFVDITRPGNPVVMGTVPVNGEPTSVTISPDGIYALSNVRVDRPEAGEPPPDPSGSGDLSLIHIPTMTVLGNVPIGFHPDSCKATEIDGRLVVVVAIENEPLVVGDDGLVTGDEAPGNPGDVSRAGLIQVVTVDTTNPAGSLVVNVELPATILDEAGCHFPDDPQPEFVDIYGTTAAVALQENNGMAIVDITRPCSPLLVRVFSLGVAADRPADLTEDDHVHFTETYPADTADEVCAGSRFPDAIAFSPDGTLIYSADEGELDFTGGRGWSAWHLDGSQAWDDGGALERCAVNLGHYPDGRSENKGIEVEGITTASFGCSRFAFVLSERGSFMGVYDIRDTDRPKLVQALPTGTAPESVVAIPHRNLVVAAAEVSGSITIFEGTPDPYQPAADQPRRYSAGFMNAWDRISTPTTAAAGDVPTSQGPDSVVDRSILAPEHPGWWIASKGNAAYGKEHYRPNLLVQLERGGKIVREVGLPEAIDAPGGGLISGHGLEGVAVSGDGHCLVAPIQRPFVSGDPNHALIARLDLTTLDPVSGGSLRCTGDWELFRYPLDPAASPDQEISLTELVSIGWQEYAVIEQDGGIGKESTLKKIYRFSLDGLADGDMVTKSEWLDILDL